MQDSREEDEELWRKIQDANTPSRAEMARAEMELQAIEPDPTFSVDSSRLSAAAPPAGKRRRRSLLAACAAVLAMSALAIALAERPSGAFSKYHTVEECLEFIQMPPTYQKARLSIGPVATTCIRCAQTLKALSEHESNMVAEAANSAMSRLRAGRANGNAATFDDYVAAVMLKRSGDADDASLVAAVADLESVASVCMRALELFEAPAESEAEQNITLTLSKVSAILKPKD